MSDQRSVDNAIVHLCCFTANQRDARCVKAWSLIEGRRRGPSPELRAAVTTCSELEGGHWFLMPTVTEDIERDYLAFTVGVSIGLLES